VSRELALRRAVYGVRLVRDANVRGLRASESAAGEVRLPARAARGVGQGSPEQACRPRV